ncbi:MAG: GPP34 family phosphoprotein [Ornithinimicrobium sp.]|uniref:GPP34 family phosphoprotein n=1 Tax=Ornithinimicrobium sp. TaxID=1977084 RepID=UPI003D9B6FAE
MLDSRRTLRGRRYPQIDAHREYAVRTGLREVLTRQRPPDERETVLITLVAGMQLAPEILPDMPADVAIAAERLARECPVSTAWALSQYDAVRTGLSPIYDSFDALGFVGDLVSTIDLLP